MKYLLPCQCGREIEVLPSQAGETVTCGCGAALEVPTLRQIRHLKKSEEAPASSIGGGWGLRQGTLTAGLLASAVLAGLGGYVWANDPPAPDAFNPDRRAQRISQGLEQLSPAQSYQQWVSFYEPMREFSELTDPREQALVSYLAKRSAIRWALFTAGGLSALGGVAAFVALPK